MKLLALITEDTYPATVRQKFKDLLPEVDQIDCRMLGLGGRKLPVDLKQLNDQIQPMNLDLETIPERFQGLIVYNDPIWLPELHLKLSGKIPIYRFKEDRSNNAHSIERIDTPNDRHLVVNGVQLH